MKIFNLIFLSLLLVSESVFAAPSPSLPPSPPSTPPANPTARISIFSTSTDWEALTDLMLSEYNGKFIYDRKLIGRGLVLYYLDGFPCYGLGYGVRIWLGPNGEYDGTLHIACVYAPEEINFAWRNALRDADEAVSTGILTCPVKDDGNELIINLSKCNKGKDWKDIKEYR